MGLYLKLFAVAFIPVAQAIIVYYVKTKCEFFKKLSYTYQQIAIGVFFGISAILGTVFGVDVGGAKVNARDAAPICCGLIFGAPAGIITGAIGGIYRFIASYFPTTSYFYAGTFSQAACTIATIVAGIFAGTLRKHVFDNKCPHWIFGFVTAIVAEALHLTLFYLLRLDQIEKAFDIVRICAVPMMLCNAFSVGLAIVLINICSKEKLIKKWKYQQVTQQVQFLLLAVVLVAYFATTMFVYTYQTSFATINSTKTITTSIEDAEKDLSLLDEDDISHYASNKHVDNTGFIILLDSDKKIISINEQYIKYLNQDIQMAGVNVDEASSGAYSVTLCDIDCLAEHKCVNVGGVTYYIISAIPKDEVFSERESSLVVNSFMEILVFALLFIIVYELIKQLVVNNLRKVNKGLGKIIDGDLDVNFEVNTSQEFTSLSSDINSTVATLKRYIDEASQRLDKELEFAKSIQHSALPSVFPPYPNIKDFDISAKMYTAKQVGGDFYDFYLLHGKKLAFVVADVSGKGVPAAMLMMRAKTMIKSLAETGISLEEIFERANEKLNQNNDAGMFVTAWMGILDFTTGIVECVNAGHENPFICRKDGLIETISTKHDVALGVIDEIKYKVEKIKLNPGDMLIQYTDGVTEATNSDKKLFGTLRLGKSLYNCVEKTPDNLLNCVKQDIDSFVGSEPQFDDITMLCLRYNGD